MMAVRIRVGEDHDLPVAQAAEIESLAHAAAEGGQIGQFFVFEHLGQRDDARTKVGGRPAQTEAVPGVCAGPQCPLSARPGGETCRSSRCQRPARRRG